MVNVKYSQLRRHLVNQSVTKQTGCWGTGWDAESIQSFIPQRGSIHSVHVYRYWCDRRARQSKGSSSTASKGRAGSASNGPVEKKIDQLEAQDNIEASSPKVSPELCLAACI